MSDAQQHPSYVFPLKPGVILPHFDWPTWPPQAKPKPPAPHSAAAYFTNPDARLRPVEPSLGPRLYFTKEAPNLPITQYNFPTLYRDIHAMLQRAGLGHYNLFIREDYRGTAGSNVQTKLIILSAKQMSTQTYESMLYEVGHEIGHQWRHTHDKEKPIPIRGGNFIHFRDYKNHLQDTAKRDEAEADLMGFCLLGSAEPMRKAWEVLGFHRETGTHPSTTRRLAAVEAASPYDCFHFGLHSLLVPPVTPRVPKAAQQKHK